MYVLHLDVEATTNQLIYDIGLLVLRQEEDGSFTNVYQKQYIIEEVFDNRPLFDTAYYHKKRPKYYGLLRAKNDTEKVELKVALRELRKLIRHYEIETVIAYNVEYDYGAFEKTCDYFNKSNPIAELNPICIYALASKYIHDTQDYRDYCTQRNHYSVSGYFKTNAEITYRYVVGNEDFEEDHTGLKDCLIELEILNFIINNGGEFEEVKKSYIKADISQRMIVEIRENGKPSKTYNFSYKQKFGKGNKITLIK